MAECYQQLVGDDATITERISLGEKVLAEIPIDDLLLEDRPRFFCICEFGLLQELARHCWQQ